ncbi:NPCBM/NEW2 domain-containing protein [Nocardioides sp. J2M5]|uniref:NPCBM/NEW2 domain-containing protein n=1 Tax=Nocardioides palaemonis TaxID=2829810 RepID=UPI001BA7BC2A|nr:NPCBM/NEW2 domain-containing protein [Nocardioides palaemonis]MBS2939466.1 NPCBM/NEW2 domain-containing protein [Nocardioides palaemonis]
MRLVIALLIGILVPTTLGAAVASAPASAESQAAEHVARPRVTLIASPTWVRKGRIVTLRGTVTGVRGRVTVTILQRNKGARRWVVEAVRRTNGKGRFTHREDVNSGDRTYKACVRRSCDSVVVHMGKRPPRAAKPTSVSITALGATSIEAGQATTVSGAASRNLNGRTIIVQAFDNATSTWSAVGEGTVSNGAWAAAATVTTAGRAVSLRAVFPGGIGLLASETTAVSITVFGWYYLEDMDTVSGSYYGGPRELNGVTYPKSIAVSAWSNSAPEFNLSRSCTRLVSTIGVSDYASTSTTYAVNVTTDALTKYSRTGMSLGQSYPLDIDVQNTLRLRIEHILTGGDDHDYLVLGDARVLCAF